ncbi:MAG: uroporphyrinogen-III synthase [Acidimicrobiales bacterium]
MAAFIVKVVVTREAGKNASLIDWLPSDAIITEVPLTTTEFRDDDEVRRELAASRSHGDFAALVLTSVRSVRYIDVALAASSPDVRVFSVGPATSGALVAHGVQVARESDGTAATLANYVDVGPVLLLGAAAMRPELASALRAKGIDVVSVACYETQGATLSESDERLVRDADVVFIGAPSAWSVARELVTPETWVVVPGASTASDVRRDHARVIEGWGPELCSRLVELSIAPEA